MHKAEPYATKIDVGRAILPADALSSASRRRLKAGGSQDLGTCNITQFAQNPRAGISAVAAFSCTCILSETANQPKLDIAGQNGYFCKFLGFACQPHYFSASHGRGSDQSHDRQGVVARTDSTGTDCRLRGGAALPAPSRWYPRGAGSGPPRPASSPRSAPSRLRPTASSSTGHF